MRNWWIRFGCFLTGYNYRIINNASEIAAKSVKKYTSALLIVCTLWAFIGYAFTERYLKAPWYGAMLGAALFCLIIVQIERQIILAIRPHALMKWARMVIALAMAFIGTLIIDQRIFKDDIELKQQDLIGARVDKIIASRTKELRNQIQALENDIRSKEQQRKMLSDDVLAHPTITSKSSTNTALPVSNTTTDASGNIHTVTKLKPVTSTTLSSVVNPNMAQLEPLDKAITDLRMHKMARDSQLVALRPQLEKQLKETPGFLDELDVMILLFKDSTASLVVWLIWFILLFGLEMFILLSKMGDEGSDYEVTIRHQMDFNRAKLEAIRKLGQV